MRVSEICVKRIRVNQGLGVHWNNRNGNWQRNEDVKTCRNKLENTSTYLPVFNILFSSFSDEKLSNQMIVSDHNLKHL